MLTDHTDVCLSPCGIPGVFLTLWELQEQRT